MDMMFRLRLRGDSSISTRSLENIEIWPPGGDRVPSCEMGERLGVRSRSDHAIGFLPRKLPPGAHAVSEGRRRCWFATGCVGGGDAPAEGGLRVRSPVGDRYSRSVQVEPLSDQKVDLIDERWSLEPDGPTHTYTDLYGNPCRRLISPRDADQLQATVIAPDATEDVDEEAPSLRLISCPTRH